MVGLVKFLVLIGFVQASFGQSLEKYLYDVADLTPAQIQERSDFLTDKILELVEKLKSSMKEGIPDMGIPPLDPLRLGDVALGPLSLGSAGTIDVVNFTQLTVYGLPDFEISGIKMNIFSLNLLLNLTIPHLRLEGGYALDGLLLGFVPVFGGGPFHLEGSDILIATKSKLKARDGKLSIETLDLYLEIGHVHVHFQGLLGGGDLGDQLNGILQSTGNVLVKKFGPTIGQFFSEFVRNKLNELLQNVEIGNIVG